MSAVLEQETERAPTVPAAITPMRLIELAVMQGAEIDKLERLLAMQERWQATEAKRQFTEAIAQFKSKPLAIYKNKRVSYPNKTGGRTDYKHATLDNVCQTIISGLSAVGISHKWTPEQKGSLIKVTCVLTHKAGHSETTSLEANADDSGGKNSIQAVGSTVSYLERYTILAATGLAVKDQDDDGAAAGPRKADPEEVYRVEPRTVIDQPTARTETAPRRETRPSVEDTPARAVPDAKPMTEGQRNIITAKLKNASLSGVDLQAHFGRPLADPSWNYDDFNRIAAWIVSRR
jgi:hypothetical protein